MLFDLKHIQVKLSRYLLKILPRGSSLGEKNNQIAIDFHSLIMCSKFLVNQFCMNKVKLKLLWTS